MCVYLIKYTEKFVAGWSLDHKVWIIFVFIPINIHNLNLSTNQSCNNFMSADF